MFSEFTHPLLKSVSLTWQKLTIMKDHAEPETEDPDLEGLPPQREQEKEENREGLILSSRFIRMLNKLTSVERSENILDPMVSVCSPSMASSPTT